MWFLFALVATLGWGFADVFYKKSSDENDRYSHLRIAVWVGLVMGLCALIILPFSETGWSILNFENLLSYAPASLAYILSMVIGYAGMRYLEISIISPVQNSSGAFSAIAMTVFFALKGDGFKAALEEGTGFVFGPETATEIVTDVFLILSVLFICAGVIALGIFEQKAARAEIGMSPENRKYKIGALALIFPLLYCLFDTIGTAADGIILDETTGPDFGELDVLVLYGLTFFVIGLGAWLFLLVKEKKPYRFYREVKTKGVAALMEEFGQFFYVFAMAAKPVLAAPMIASYCIVSVIASRLILKERLKKVQWISVLLVILGIVLLGVIDGLDSLQ